MDNRALTRAATAVLDIVTPQWGDSVVAGNGSIVVSWTWGGGLTGADLVNLDVLRYDPVDGPILLNRVQSNMPLSTRNFTIGVPGNSAPSNAYFFTLTAVNIAGVIAASAWITVLPPGGGGGIAVTTRLAGSTNPLTAATPVFLGQNLSIAWVIAAGSVNTTLSAASISVELWLSLAGEHTPFGDFQVATLAAGLDVATTTLSVMLPASPDFWQSAFYFVRVLVPEQPWVLGNGGYISIGPAGVRFTSPTFATTLNAGSSFTATWVSSAPTPAPLNVDLFYFSFATFNDTFIANVARGTTASLLTVPTLSTYESGFYSLYLYDGATPATSVISSQSEYFFVDTAKVRVCAWCCG